MEKLMYYIWYYRLFDAETMETVDGKRVEVLNPGTYNRESGPDFFNASLIIDGQHWVGNVEMHCKASDWFRHGHDKDASYDSVVLHVVGEDDRRINRRDGKEIPQCVLKCMPSMQQRLGELLDNSFSNVPCARTIRGMKHIYLTDWFTALAFQRFNMKSDKFMEIVKAHEDDWEEATYILIARYLGTNKNSDPFERLARSTPLGILRKHADSLLALEAILFGQSGLLPTVPAKGSYAEVLSREYAFYKAKFRLKCLPREIWKIGRVYPQGLPYRRIALLAKLIYMKGSLLDGIVEAKNLKELMLLFRLELGGYWTDHYNFEDVTMRLALAPGKDLLKTMVINAGIPVAYSFLVYHGDYDKANNKIEQLQQLRTEENFITKMFRSIGLDSKSAFMSQALIQLRREYCEKRKCMYCRIGYRHLKANHNE